MMSRVGKASIKDLASLDIKATSKDKKANSTNIL